MLLKIVGMLSHSAVDSHSPLLAVVDVRGASFDTSAAEIRGACVQLRALGVPGRIALVVASDVHFGIGRMIGMMTADSRFEVRPFRDADAAMSWVLETSTSGAQPS